MIKYCIMNTFTILMMEIRKHDNVTLITALFEILCKPKNTADKHRPIWREHYNKQERCTEHTAVTTPEQPMNIVHVTPIYRRVQRCNRLKKKLKLSFSVSPSLSTTTTAVWNPENADQDEMGSDSTK